MTVAAVQRVDIKLSGPQTKAFRRVRGLGAKRNKVCLSWGRGVGKSWFIRLVMWLLIAEWDGKRLPGSPYLGIRIVLFMPTLSQFKKVHGKLLETENSGAWKFLGGEYNHTDFVIRFPGGSSIQIVSAEQRNAVAGIRCDVVAVDETDDIEIETYDALVGPWMSEPFSLQLTIFAGTPRRGRYGLLYRQHRRGLNGEPHHFTSHATYRDVQHVDSAYVALERANVSPQLFSREWECNFDSAEGLVYPMFDESFHVRMPDPRVQWTEFLVGGDHGWNDPGVLLLIGVAGSGRDAVCHILGEVYETQKSESWWASQVPPILEQVGKAKIRFYVDPSQPSRINAYKQQGAICESVDNSIEDGVSCVADMLSIRETGDGQRRARLYVAPNCVNTIREFGLYRRKRDPRNADRVLDDILDRDNHACDSARYALFSRFGRPASTRTDSGNLDFG